MIIRFLRQFYFPKMTFPIECRRTHTIGKGKSTGSHLSQSSKLTGQELNPNMGKGPGRSHEAFLSQRGREPRSHSRAFTAVPATAAVTSQMLLTFLQTELPLETTNLVENTPNHCTSDVNR